MLVVREQEPSLANGVCCVGSVAGYRVGLMGYAVGSSRGHGVILVVGDDSH